MATRYNYTGKLVTDGLVLNLDAAKRDSYPGSGTTWYDLSGNGNNGTLTNGPTYTGVSKDAAIVFDGVDDVVVGNTSTYYIKNSGDPITVSTWTKPSRLGGQYQDIVTNRSGSDSYNWILYQHTTDGSIGFHGSSQNKSTYIPLTGSWVNITNTVTVSKISTLYVNGSPYQTVTGFEYGPKSKNRLSIGAGSAPYVEPFLGSIATAQIYNHPLSQFEVFQNFNALKGRYGIPDIVTDGLVLNLDAGNPYSYLSGSSGTTWTDVSGQGNNGTLTNGASYANGAVSFDGVDDYATIPTFSIPTGSFSCESFFQWSNLGIDKGSIFSLNYNYPTSGYLIRQKDDGSGKFVIWSDYGSESGIFSTAALTVNTWNHVVVVQSAGNCSIYINGVLDSTQSLPNPVLNQSYPVLLGVRATSGLSAGAYLPGRIGVSKIYNRALTQAEITQNFNALRGRYGI